jgi:pimeloyl-ACP methyl ester carboxylesterase
MTYNLPGTIRSRLVKGVNGLDVHLLEAGFESAARQCVLLLHGFPELAFSWRRMMPQLAAAGFHVIAPDQRGYGRTTGWDRRYEADLAQFYVANLVRDAVALVNALGYGSVAAVIGHDSGSSVAAWCALTRPDVFRSVALMSAPFPGPPNGDRGGATLDAIDRDLAALPHSRKHYQAYYSTRDADRDMRECRQGIHAFLRAYYHFKSADWKGNQPFRLGSSAAAELAKLPAYYIMDRGRSMAETVAEHMPSDAEIAACDWLPEAELAVYSAEFARTGFQGGLQFYRCAREARFIAELQAFAGRTIDVPSCFIAGRQDWGVYQKPGEFERMQKSACSDMRACELVEGAGHWVQQEQPERVLELLLRFLRP